MTLTITVVFCPTLFENRLSDVLLFIGIKGVQVQHCMWSSYPLVH